MTSSSAERLHLGQESRDPWLWLVGIVRLAVLFIAAAGVYLWRPAWGMGYLLIFYGFGLISALWYLSMLRRATPMPRLATWTQILIDFGVVGATITFSGGPISFFTFLFAVLVLEAGLLLGFIHSFYFATLATVFMCAQAAFPPPEVAQLKSLELWYNALLQGLAFYFMAFISGYWNQRIHRMQQFQRDILDNMNSGFLITDATGVISAQNKAAGVILGLTPGSTLGRPVQEVLRLPSGAENPIITALRAERDFSSYEFYAQTSRGDTKLLGLTTSRIYDSRNRLKGIIASFSDLTDMAKMREELKRYDLMVAVGELSAALAHEIRNPVAAIRGAVDELRGSLDTPPLVEKLAAIAIRESDHLNDILTGFLDFARNPTLKGELFDLRDVMHEVVGMLERKYAGNNALRLESHLPEQPCRVIGDPSQIRQVFTNLGVNAVEAMEGHGALTVTLLPGPGSHEIRFEDEGPGISPDLIARIFEPFYTTKDSGVGMGLAVCQRIVVAHNGAIRAETRSGRGAAMSVRLPAARM